MVTNQGLVKIASIGGFVIAGTGYAFHFRIQHDIKQSETYKDAIRIVYTHKKAIPYLGEPVTMGRIKYGNGQRTLENDKSLTLYKWFKIPLKGSNTKGNLYYEVTRSYEHDNVPEVSKIEMTFDSLPGKTFIIRDYAITRDN